MKMLKCGRRLRVENLIEKETPKFKELSILLRLKRNGEPSMLSLVLGAICFSGVHLGVAGTPLRDRAIATLGEGAYRVVFSDRLTGHHRVARHGL